MNHIIDRLESVRETGPGRWLARCPAHPDKSPSLAIRETDDGTILLHCFTECDVQSIVAAIGVEFTDLFPPSNRIHRPREGRPFPALDVLRAMAHEVKIVAIAASDITARRPLTDDDYWRVLVAQRRIDDAVRLAEGR